MIAFAAAAWAFREAQRAPARALLMDTVARAIAGSESERVAIAAREVPRAARLTSRALARPASIPPLHAALLDALAVGDAATVTTPAVCAALALGESVDAPGALVLDAIVAGAEIAVRAERAMSGHAERGWDARGTCGRLGAAIAATRVLALQRDAVRNAFGIAATAAGGLLSARGTMTASYVVAAAAADGVEAALLARADFTGAPAALEGRRGLAALMSDAFDEPALGAELGTTFLYERIVPGAPERPAAHIAAIVERVERTASIRELIDATMPR